MKNKYKIVEWAMRHFKIVFLISTMLLVAGIYGILNMPKQEFPTITVRKGLIIGVYPGATPMQVEEQLTKPLEKFLFSHKEINRAMTYSHSQNGMLYIYIQLQDNIKNKEEVWSKIRHKINDFKKTLSPDILEIIVDDDFGETSALLVSIESETKTYRQLDKYLEQLEDKLRKVKSVSNLRKYGIQNEQITINLNRQKLANYNIPITALAFDMFLEGLVSHSGEVESGDGDIPIHIRSTYETVIDIEEKIVYTDPHGNFVRIKDIAEVVKEYPKADSYIEKDGVKCLILSIEMMEGNDIIYFGKEVKKTMNEFIPTLPKDITISTIVDQSKIVDDSVNFFLIEMLMAIIAVILVTLILMPLRVAGVATTSIPITIFITLAIMYALGFELNMVTFAGLIVVLGLVVDDCIVIIDGYIDNLDAGISRWHASVMSAKEYFKSLISATFAISVTFFPFLVTFQGELKDFITSFPWTVTITLFVSLAVAVLIIPIIQYFFIRKGLHSKDDKPHKKTLLDRVQTAYDKILPILFNHPRLLIASVLASLLLGFLLFFHTPIRMMPYAERNMFATEIHLPKGSSIQQTALISDSMRKILSRDERVTSITAFVGTSSPRFHAIYSPQMPATSYAQFIVNTASNKATVEVLNEYADRYNDHFPNAYINFKQMDNEATETPFEIWISGAEIETLKIFGNKLKKELKHIEGLTWIRDDHNNQRPYVDVNINMLHASRLGISGSTVGVELSNQFGGIKLGTVWEDDYPIAVKLKGSRDTKKQKVTEVENVYIPSLAGTAVSLRQIADVSTAWYDGTISHRNGVPTFSVMANTKRGVNADDVFPLIVQTVNKVKEEMPDTQITIDYGGFKESDEELLPYIIWGLIIALFIIYFILIFHFQKVSLANLILASTLLCLFGAAFGIWISGLEFGMTSVLGIVCLFGIVVRNGIILFDYAERLRKEQRMTVKEAAIEAGKRRLRPIVLTSIAASVGVIPMLVSGSPLWAPMAAVITSGALISMFFVISVLPVAYWLVFRTKDNKNRTKRISITLLLLLITCSTYSQNAYTIDEIKAIALENNKSLKSMRLAIEQSKEQSKEVFTSFFPSLKANGTYLHIPNGLLGKDIPQMTGLPLPPMKNGTLADITAIQPIFAGGQIHNSNKLAKVGIEVNNLNFEEAQNQLQLLAEQYFWNIFILEENEKTTIILDRLISTLYSEVQNAYQVGITNKNELLQVELRKNEIKSQQLTLKNGVKNLKHALSQLMGIDNDEISISVDMSIERVNPFVEHVEHRMALVSTPNYKLLDKKLESNKLDKNIEVGKMLPQIGVGASYSYHNLFPRERNSMIYFVQVSVPISDWWAGSHRKRQKQLQLKMAEYDKQDIRDKLLLEMNTLKSDLGECSEQVNIAMSSINVSEENLRLNTDYYKAGISTLSELLEAQSLFQASKDKLAESYAKYMIKRAEYRKATGR